ncbi:MAG TPA: hypothetical protein DEO51_02630 [Clostridiales bacterium]|jgi:hypothetical protein|nr:hypothetical protein [Clostridiales bacterium]
MKGGIFVRNYKISKPTYYSIIPADVRYDKDLMDKAKLLYSEITALSNSMGYCYASNQYFADLYSITIRQVQTLLKDLSNKGYIKVDRNSKPRKIHIATVKFSSSYREENFMVDREENFTHNNTSNNNKKNNTPSPELVSEFKAWYSKYPNPRNEQQTMRNYISTRNKYSAEQLMSALDNYLADIEKNNTDKRYIKYSTNFVGREQAFVDYLNTPAQPVSTEETDDSYIATIEAEDPEYAARLRRRDNDV